MKRNNFNKIGSKGQAMSFDIIIASFIFLLLIASALTVYNTQQTSLQEQNTLQEMHLAATNALNTILTDQNSTRGGIVNEKIQLSQNKINDFNSMDYNTLKSNLALDQYEFYIKIYDYNSTTLEKGFTNSNRAVSIQRIAQLNSKAKKVLFTLYEK
jgi:hypothetical protein